VQIIIEYRLLLPNNGVNMFFFSVEQHLHVLSVAKPAAIQGRGLKRKEHPSQILVNFGETLPRGEGHSVCRYYPMCIPILAV
jgi:hypothetical protein